MSFKRMVVIPEEEYQRNCTPATAVTADSSSAAVPSDVRVACYESNLPRQPPTTTSSIGDFSKAFDDAPKNYRSRAKQLYHWLLTYHVPESIGWNESGEVFTPYQRLTASHIIDLVIFTVNEVRRKPYPEGWLSFLRLLKQLNVPRTLLSRKTLNILDEGEKEVEKQPSTSPAKKRRRLDEEEAVVPVMKRRQRQPRKRIRPYRRLEPLPSRF